MINGYGFVELPLQKIGTKKSNEHDEFVASLSEDSQENPLDSEKVQQAGQFIDALDSYPIHGWDDQPDPSNEILTDKYDKDAFDFAASTVKAYAQKNPAYAEAANDYIRDMREEGAAKWLGTGAISSWPIQTPPHGAIINPKAWIEDFHTYMEHSKYPHPNEF